MKIVGVRRSGATTALGTLEVDLPKAPEYDGEPMARRPSHVLTHRTNLALAGQDLRQPLHARVRQILRERILADFSHGDRFYSERELIQKLNVSQPTIRRALTDLADEGYLQPDPRRGFFVQHHAEARYVGLITTAWESSVLPEDVWAYSGVCRERNETLIVHPLHKGETLDDIMRTIQHKPTEERILLAGLTVEFTLEVSARLQAEGYRHLVVGPKIPGITGSSLSLDHDAEVDLILNHLIELGHERIVFLVNEPRALLTTSLRIDTVKQKLKERKLVNSHLVFCDTREWEDSFQAAYIKTREIMQSRPRPTAIVSLSGVGAWAVLRDAIEHNIKVPQQLSIVSFHPMANASLLPVPITELAFSHADRAKLAIETLWSDAPDPVHLRLTPHLVPRKSSGSVSP